MSGADQLSDTNISVSAIAPPSNSNISVSAIAPGPDITITTAAMPKVEPVPPFAHCSTNPYLVYLSQLGVSSRRTMRESLEKIARMVSDGSLDALNFSWSELRYQHTQAIYTHLLETKAPATANKMMAAVGRVLKCCLEVGASFSRRLP